MNTNPLIAVLTGALLVGCASTSSTVSRSKDEPGVIALRNSTGRPLTNVRIREDRDVTDGPARLGAMSPVLPDITYTFVRPTNAPSLPRRIRVEWIDAAKREQSAVVDTRPALAQVTGAPDEALLLDIGPGGEVDARIDRPLPSR